MAYIFASNLGPPPGEDQSLYGRIRWHPFRCICRTAWPSSPVAQPRSATARNQTRWEVGYGSPRRGKEKLYLTLEPAVERIWNGDPPRMPF